MFTHLNVHSSFSKMSGVAGLRQLLQRARQYQQSHLALTEINGLWGFIRFVQTARVEQVRPIAGANLITPRSDIILLAEDQVGYENLCHILSRRHASPEAALAQLIQGRSSGLFLLAHQEQDLKQLRPYLPATHLFVEMRCGIPEQQARQLAQQYDLECVATADVYFLTPEDQKTHQILRAIAHNTTLTELPETACKDGRHFFRSEKQMVACFPNSLDAINNAQYLAERCKTDWNFVNTIFPDLSLKKNHRANQKLRRLVYSGAKKRYQAITEPVSQRIEYELDMILKKGFAPYFLVVRDIVRHTKATIGRGSGAASIVSYCLFITQVDPLKYNLVFERFIHPERVSMPDIDVDFPWDERDEVLDYIFEKYGLQRTAMVSSQVFMQPRSAVREVGKVYGLSNEELKAVTKRIGYHARRAQLLAWIKQDKRFQHLDLDDTLIEILKQAEKIMGAFRNSSVHPGGVVVVPDDMRNYVPVLMAPKGVQIVEWEKDQVEDAGLLKIDILGNRSLSVVRDTLRQLQRYRDIHLDYHAIKGAEDRQTQQLIQAGKTMGVFYIESPATRQLLAKAGVTDFEHVVIYSSIIRPAANRYTNLMLERIHGKPWQLLHPDLQCLAESYGIMVYEEQVSIVARKIAGFSYRESDYIRKVISRPALGHLVPRWQQKFINGAVKRGYSQQLAHTLWEMIKSFSGYSFCKPHSASYARLSFTCAYLKSHYPAEFLAAVITNQGGYYSTYAYLSEARRCGITILPPHINLSELEYKGKQDKIRIGFMAINTLKHKTIAHILKERKAGFFQSLEDFFARVDIDFADAMALTNAGCLKPLEPELTHKDIAFRVASFFLQECGRQLHTPQQLSSPSRTALSRPERLQLEIESFGFPISEHPLRGYLELLGNRIIKARDMARYQQKTVHLAGVYITRKIAATKHKEMMGFVTFEDETAIFECVMFPQVYQQYGDLLNWEKLFIVRGKVEAAWGVYTLTVEKLLSLPRYFEKISNIRSAAHSRQERTSPQSSGYKATV